MVNVAKDNAGEIFDQLVKERGIKKNLHCSKNRGFSTNA